MRFERGRLLWVLALAFVPALAPALELADGSAAALELGGARYTVEIAASDASRARGLMDRPAMARDHGMLFVFDDDAPRAFWMKNTLITLDMLFFDAQRRLVSVRHDVPPCRADPCRAWTSGAPARYVLELNAGEARRLGLAPGDEFRLLP